MVTHTRKSMDKAGKVGSPARGQLNSENENFPVPVSVRKFVPQDGLGSPFPRQSAHLHTQAESGPHIRDSSRVPRRRPFIYLNRHTPSNQSRNYQVTHLRTDGVQCRESAGTGPVNLKVVRTIAALAGHHGPTKMRLSFPHPLLVWSGYVESTVLYTVQQYYIILKNIVHAAGGDDTYSEYRYMTMESHKIASACNKYAYHLPRGCDVVCWCFHLHVRRGVR